MATQLDVQTARIRGWKLIAAHLSVTQSTAIRWANSAGLPVSRTASGGSVYAHVHELDLWLERRQSGLVGEGNTPMFFQNSAPEEPAVFALPNVPAARPARTASPRRASGLLALLAGAAVLVVLLAFFGASRPVAVARPSEPAWQQQYLAARVDWASRTPDGLRRAINGLNGIIARDARAAPAWFGLADAYVLSCEFAGTDRKSSFDMAKSANQRGLALAPADPDGNRIAGFLSYWTDRDISKAAPLFEASIRAAPDVYLAHLWYGNTLVDSGRLRPALDQIDKAMVLAPDSPAVQVDYAAALWQTGQDQRARAMLEEVEKTAPDNSSAPNWLALFDLQSGDVGGYIAQSQLWARLIADREQAQRLAREAEVYRSEGAAATLRYITSQPTMHSPYWHGGALAQAMAASLVKDRARLILILRQGQIPDEKWRDLRFPAATFVAWRNDSEVNFLLNRAFRSSVFSNYPRLTN